MIRWVECNGANDYGSVGVVSVLTPGLQCAKLEWINWTGWDCRNNSYGDGHIVGEGVALTPKSLSKSFMFQEKKIGGSISRVVDGAGVSQGSGPLILKLLKFLLVSGEKKL